MKKPKEGKVRDSEGFTEMRPPPLTISKQSHSNLPGRWEDRATSAPTQLAVAQSETGQVHLPCVTTHQSNPSHLKPAILSPSVCHGQKMSGLGGSRRVRPGQWNLGESTRGIASIRKKSPIRPYHKARREEGTRNTLPRSGVKWMGICEGKETGKGGQFMAFSTHFQAGVGKRKKTD